jgi:FtsH-binding integral membrane protein
MLVTTSSRSIDATTWAQEEARTMAGVYGWMMLGLLVTGGVAWFTANTPALVGLLTNVWVMIGVIVIQVGVAIFLSFTLLRLPPVAATALFLVYSALMGLTSALIIMVYTLGSIATAVLITAVAFGALSAFGYFTKRDLSGLGLFLFIAIVGLAIASLVNWFLANPLLDWVISIVGVVLFAGHTAFQTQQIKRRLAEARDARGAQQVTIYGAFTLYLNLIIMFSKMLRLLGKQK